MLFLFNPKLAQILREIKKSDEIFAQKKLEILITRFEKNPAALRAINFALEKNRKKKFKQLTSQRARLFTRLSQFKLNSK